MLKQAFEFMQQTDRPHVHGKARAKILALVKEIDAVYKQHTRKPTGMVCDICGKGDTDDIAEPGGQPGIESEPLHGRPEEARQQHDHGEQHEEDDHRRLPVGRDLSGVPVEANDRAERRVAGIGHEIRRQLLAQPG